MKQPQRKLSLMVFALFVLLASCGRPPAKGAYPGRTWQTAATPEAFGWSSEKLAKARAYSERIGSAAVMIVDDGIVVDAWGDVTRNYMCHSVRKSLLSALYGIYVAEGKIDPSKTLEELGVDDRTPLTEAEKQATVADLLKARSGVYIPAAGETAGMKAARPERGSHPPGTFWYYNNWDFNALGTIFDRETGERNIYQAFKTRIADPIGMQDYPVGELRYDYDPSSMHPYYGFLMSARDLARFGLLFARGGRWENEQIVPESWIVESTTPYSDAGPDGGYGYMWWVTVDGSLVANVVLPNGSFSARGYRGQYVLVVPEWDVVIVHRFDTFRPQGQVSGTEFGYLVRLILQAGPKALDLKTPHMAESIALSEADLVKYVGQYRLSHPTEAEGGSAPAEGAIELHDGNLVLVVPGQLFVILVPIAPNRFQLAIDGSYYADFHMKGERAESMSIEIGDTVKIAYKLSTEEEEQER